jgi:cytochrome b involved in lipid metabolism
LRLGFTPLDNLIKNPIRKPSATTATMSKQLTKAEVAQHKDEKAMYIIVDDGVYDIAGMS